MRNFFSSGADPARKGAGGVTVPILAVAFFASFFLLFSSAFAAAPTVEVSSTTADGSYKAGATVDVLLTFSEAVTSTDPLTVTLETGVIDRTCLVSALTSATTGTCTYTVQAGDTSSDLTVNSIVVDNTGTILSDSTSDPADLTPTSNLVDTSAIIIDTTSPVVSGVANATSYKIDVVPTFNEGTATLGGNPFASGETVSSENSYVLVVTDDAGNATTVNFVVDKTAPSAPTVAEQGSTDLADSLMNDAESTTTTFRVTLSGTGAVEGDSVELYLDASSFSSPKTDVLDATDITNGYVDFVIEKDDLGIDGEKSLIAQIMDVAGNFGEGSSDLIFTLDTASPTTEISYSDADGIVKAGDSLTITATFNKAMADAPIVNIELSGANTQLAVEMTEVDATHYTYTHTVAAGDGATTVALSLGTDVAGNVIVGTPTAGATFTVDNTSPSEPTANVPAGTYGSAQSVSLSGTGTIYYTLDGSTPDSSSPSSTAYTVPVSVDGNDGETKTLKAIAYDAAGNASSVLSVEYVFDKAAPSAPSNLNLDDADDTGKSATDNLTKNTSALTIMGTAEAGSTVNIYDTDGTTVLGTGTATGGNFSIDVALTAGVHSLTAKATDASGNTSLVSSALDITVDTTAPAFVSAQTKTTTTIQVVFSEVITANKDDFGVGADISGNDLSGGSGYSTGTVLFTVSAIETGDTPIFYAVRTGIVDNAGNEMLLTAQITPTDGIKPVLASVTPITTPTNDNTPNYTFSATEAGAITVAGGCTLGATAAVAGNNTIALNTLADGTYSACTITVTDSATNVSTALTIPSFVVDTLAPTLSISEISGGYVNDTEDENVVAVSGLTNAEDSQTVTVTINSETYTATVSSGAWTLDVPSADIKALTEGTISVVANVSDLAGNSATEASQTFVYDKTVAALSFALNSDTGTASDNITSDNVVNISELEVDATWEYTLNGGTNWTAGTGTSFSLTADTTFAIGAIKVRQTDLAANASVETPNAVQIVEDSTVAAPTFVLHTDTGSSNSDGVTSDNVVDVTLASDVASWEYTLNGGTNWTAGTGTSFSLTADTTFAIGAIKVRQTDLAANASVETPNAAQIVEDSTNPTPLTTDVVATNDVINLAEKTAGVAITGTNETGATITVLGNAATVTGGTWSYTLTTDDYTAMEEGAETLPIVETDLAGNVSNETKDIAIDTIAPTPTITAVGDANKTAAEATDAAGIISVTAETDATVVVTITGTSGNVIKNLTGDTTAQAVVLTAGDLTTLGEGAVTVSTVVTDTAGNPTVANTTGGFLLDTTAPTGTVGYSTSAPTNVDVVSTLTPSDTNTVTVTNNSGLLTKTFSTNGTFDFEFSDVAGNTGTATATVANIDKITPGAPTGLDLDAADDTNVNTDNETSTTTALTISGTAEASATVELFDGATSLGTVVADGTTGIFTKDVSLAEGTHSITAKATDAASNTSDASSALSIVVDTTALSVPTADKTTGNYNAAQTVTITPASGANKTYYTLDGSAPTSSSTEYTAPVLVDGADTVTTTLKAISYDLAGNAGTVLSEAFSFDKTSPTVVITDDETGTANIANGDVIFTFTFSEAVTGFDATDIIVAGGTKGTFTATSATVYTLAVTPDADSTANITVDVAAGSAQDAVTNLSVVATQAVQAVDTVAPTATVAFTSSALKKGETTVLTATFSEMPTGFVEADDLVVQNGTLSGGAFDGTGKIYTATFTPTDDLEDATNVATLATTWTDAAGNAPVASTVSVNYVVETKLPTVISVSYADAALKAGETTLITIVFSEAVAATPTVAMPNGTLGTLATADAGITWTGTFTPTVDTEDATNVAVINPFADIAGNAGVSYTSTTNYALETKLPTATPVTILSNNTTPTLAKEGNEITVSFTTSETVALPTATIAGKTATVANVSGNQYTAKYTLTASETQGAAAIAINFVDLAGNAATPVVATTNASAVTIDTTAMTVAETTPSQTPTANVTPSFVITPTENGTFTLTGTGCVLYSSVTNVLVANTQKIVTLGPLPYGTYNCSIVATDAAGNITTKALSELSVSTSSSTSSSSGGGGGGSSSYKAPTTTTPTTPETTPTTTPTTTENPNIVIINGKQVDVSTLTPKERRELFYQNTETTSPTTTPVSTTPSSFVDTQTHWAKDVIEMLKEKGVVKATEEFRPDASINRAEVVKMAVEAFAIKKDTSDAAVFQDVPQTEWYFESVISAKNAGIISVKSNFAPGKEITRAEALKIALLASNRQISSGDAGFADVASSDWYADYLYTAKTAGIVNGKADGKFYPNDSITRAEFAKILSVLFK